MGIQDLFKFVLIISVAWAIPSNLIDHLDGNSEQLLEAYIQNKTTPSSFGWLLEKLRSTGLGYLLDPNISDKQLCQICPFLFEGMFLERTLQMTNIQLTGEIAFFCSALQIENYEVCLGIIEPNVDIFAYIMDNKKHLRGKFICDLILDNLNCNHSVRDNWSVKLPSGYTVEPETKAGKLFNILQISDLHYDPLYTEGKTLDCGEPMCCQIDQADSTKDTDYCPKWSNYVKADTPLKTIQAVFEEAKNYKFDYVYLTGDLVSHRVWSTSPEQNKKVITEIIKLATAAFKKPVFFVLGNHEGHPVNTFAPESAGALNSAWLYETMLENLPVPSTNEIKKTIMKGGYYTISPQKGLRLIILNDNVCQRSDWWSIYENKDPNGQLQWMTNVLEEAEKNKEWVHVLGHIPSSCCVKVWGREFNRIINRFANTIVGQFYGHTHHDEFYIFYNQSDIDQPINVGWNGASVMPDRSNPSFKIYQVDDVTFKVLDIEEYYFNLTEANLYFSEISKLQWHKLYSFKEDFGLKSLDSLELDNLVHRMASDKTRGLLQNYYKFLHRNSDFAAKNPCGDGCMKTLLCSIVTTEYGATEKCEKLKNEFDKSKKYE